MQLVTHSASSRSHSFAAREFGHQIRLQSHRAGRHAFGAFDTGALPTTQGCRPPSTVIPEQPLTTGEARLLIARPIIGPPLSTFTSPAGTPPAASNRTATGVPKRTSRFFGASIWRPVTVTTRSIKGLFFCTASYTATVVETLQTTAPHVDRQSRRRRNLPTRNGRDQLFFPPADNGPEAERPGFRGTTEPAGSIGRSHPVCCSRFRSKRRSRRAPASGS